MDVKPSLGDNKCWSHEGKYVGKLVRLEHVGRTFDLDPKYTFDTGEVVIGLGAKFTEVPCRSGGGGGSIEMTSLSNASNSSSSNSSSSNSNQVTNINKMPSLIELLEKNAPRTEILEAIKIGADVHTPDGNGYTPLFWAASKGLTEVVAALIDKHVDLNAKTTRSGNTALMVACMNGSARIAIQLIMAGADLHIKNNSDKTAMSVLLEHLARYASPSQQPEDLQQVLTLLVQRGAGRRRRSRSRSHRNKSRSRKSRSRKSRQSIRRKVKRRQ
jgi:hypothetical protein